ncbi:MAG TPA: rhomboid family intramembrane serine protease [Rhodothermales bacterium]|nr:rhomboid family intramembrane serine protease [Rhodothermales bacterium]
MLFPISDDDRDLSGPALVTWTIFGANVLVFIYQMMNPEFTNGWSVVPYEITHGEDLVGPVVLSAGNESVQIPHARGPGLIYLTILSAMFMHGGIAHILGNLLYLWIFGDNVEHRFGHGTFLFLYLTSGVAATVAQIMLDPDSMVPSLGASGAISGVLGAYLVLFPRNRVNAIFFFSVVSVPAILVIGLWIAFQLISGWGVLSAGPQLGGVAYGAHVGGFVAGALCALVLRGRVAEHENVLTHVAKREGRSRPLW